MNTIVKHTLKGSNKKSIEKTIRNYKSEIEFLKTAPTYSEYLKFEDIEHMAKDRFSFALKNISVDAQNDYKRIKVKSLLLWGANDLNVDAIQEFSYWQNKKNKLITTKLISRSIHAMLASSKFNK